MDFFIKDKYYKIKSNNKFSIIPTNINFKVDIVEIKSGYNVILSSKEHKYTYILPLIIKIEGSELYSLNKYTYTFIEFFY